NTFKKSLSETFKEFLGVIVFAKPSEEREFMVKALSSHPRNLTKVLTRRSWQRIKNMDFY
ncbi:MAG: hypothetical protein ACK5OU_21640, partial [Dolichospermum sp.]